MSSFARGRAFVWRAAAYATRRAEAAPLVGPTLSRINGRLFARRFVPDLQRLHDVLEGTELAGRYWVWAGLLLGWAREGAPLAHDRDADFALLPEDVPRLLSALPAMRRAGFLPLMRFVNNAGEVTEYTFRRGRARFEFFVFFPEGEEWRYFTYGGPRGERVQIGATVRARALAPFEFVGRTWLKPDDHEAELTAMYGDWRTPKTNWDYLTEDLAADEREPWRTADTWWDA